MKFAERWKKFLAILLGRTGKIERPEIIPEPEKKEIKEEKPKEAEEPVEKEPVEEPVEKEPVEEPVEKEPVEKEPVEKEPVEEPVEKEPVEEPVEKEPVEKEPEEEKPNIPKEDTVYPEGIKDYERIFDTTHKDSDGTSYEVKKSTSFTFPLTILKPTNVSDYYYANAQNKSTIVLHFTVGFLMGDIATLIEQGSYLSVPFVIGRNGMVYQLFSSKYWAYHLGRATVGGNTFNSKRSTAIELSNIGPLMRHDGELRSIYGSKYCTVAEKEFYTKLQTPFRKYAYFSTFTEKQYNSLNLLLAYLCSKYNIPKVILPEEKRFRLFSSDTEAQSFEGICSHVNFRAYGKVDIGPAFDWEKIIE